MTVIIGGKISYSRTVRPADFESKNALVELSFEGDPSDADLDGILNRASTHVHATLGLKPRATEPMAEKPRTSKKPPTTVSVSAEEVAARVASNKADAAAEVVDEPQIRKSPENRVDPAAKAEMPDIPAALDRTKPEPADSLDDILGLETPKEISDADLTSEVTKKNAAIKNPIAIKGLVKKFAGDPPKGLRDVPQDKRADFLVELKAL